jgi:hypothetical protein
MGQLECKYCGAKAEAETFKEADDLIDHSIGLYKSNGCPAKDEDLLWNGEPAYEIVHKLVVKDSKPTAKKGKKSD